MNSADCHLSQRFLLCVYFLRLSFDACECVVTPSERQRENTIIELIYLCTHDLIENWTISAVTTDGNLLTECVERSIKQQFEKWNQCFKLFSIFQMPFDIRADKMFVGKFSMLFTETNWFDKHETELHHFSWHQRFDGILGHFSFSLVNFCFWWGLWIANFSTRYFHTFYYSPKIVIFWHFPFFLYFAHSFGSFSVSFYARICFP